MTPQEQLNLDIKKVIKSVITSQLALEYNEEVKHTPYYRHGFKQALNGALKVLKKAEAAHYDEFLKTLSDTDTIDDIFNQQYEMINQLAKVDPPQFNDISNIIHAYLVNPKSVMGIANKINKPFK